MLTLYNLEFHIVSLLQALVAFGLDCAEVNEHIWPIVASNEPITFCIVKPLYFAFEHRFLTSSIFGRRATTARKPLIPKE